MTKLFAGAPHTKFIAAGSAFIWTIAIATSARGVHLQAARVTQVVKDVKVVLEKAAPRPVALSDLIRHGTPVSTGTQSRSELAFNDLTITRLGANTTFSFKPGTREMNLIDGAILFQVPKGSGGATIRTAGVTAAITGTTGIGEFHPATARNPHLFSKWLCLEGQIRLYLPDGQSVEVGPGQMVTTDGISFSTVLTFDIARLVSTSLFFTGFDRPLPSLDLIVLEEQKQLASMRFAPTTPKPYSRDFRQVAGRELSCDWVECILQAAIAANPAAAGEIRDAALSAAPMLRDCIAAAVNEPCSFQNAFSQASTTSPTNPQDVVPPPVSPEQPPTTSNR